MSTDDTAGVPVVPLRVGLTGGIAAGKSEVAARLRALGATVIDHDVLAREVVAPASPGLAAVVEEFGDGVLAASGELDRPALASRVFADAGARRRLDRLIHPRVRELARSREADAVREGSRVVVHDIPLLVETGQSDDFDVVVVVDAPAELRVERLVTGRGMSPEQARARIAAQAEDATRLAAADEVVDGSGTTAALDAQVRRLWARWADEQGDRPAEANGGGHGGDPADVVLLTGFEPFDGQAVNASWAAVHAVAQTWRERSRLVTLRLPVSFDRARQQLEAALERHRPRVVVCVGEDGGRSAVGVEAVAQNRISARIPDNDGAMPDGVPVVPGAAPVLRATLPAARCVTEAQAAGLPVELSGSAGAYVCNATFFALLHRLEGSPGVLGGFVHVPRTPAQVEPGSPSLDTERVAQSLELVIGVAVDAAREPRTGAPSRGGRA